MTKTFVATLVSLVLIFSLIGCSSGKKEEPAASKTSSGTGTTTQGETAVGEKPPITLKISAFISKAEPNGVGQNPVAKYIEDKLGITMDMTSVGGGDDWPQKLNALIASNDLPVIFLVNDPVKQIPQMVKAGQIVELGPLMEKYGKNIMSNNSGKAMVELNKKYSMDGKLYSIGMDRGTWDAGTQPLAGHFFRWDLYKKIGYPKIENYTDFLNVLQQMQQAEPTTKDGQKVYALGGWFAEGQGWGDWPLYVPFAFAEGQNILTADQMVVADIQTNTISPNNALTDKNSLFWRALKFYNKANQMGILDPESFSQKGDGYNTKVNAGRYLYESEGWNIDGINNAFEKAGTPEKGMVALPAMSGVDQYTLISNLPAGERTYAISKNAKDPERALELLDFLSSYEASRIIWNGLEGTNWNMENGKPVPTDEFLKQNGSDVEFMKKTGALIYQHFVGFASGAIDPATNTVVNLYSNSDQAIARKLKPVHIDMLEHYGAKTLFELYTSKVKAYQANSLINLGELPDDLKTYDTNLQAFTFKSKFKLILAKDDAEFDKLQDEFIKNLDQFKVNEIFDYWKTKGDQSSKELAPIYDLLK